MFEHLDLIIPAFVAGLLMFFAPCTLPLVPGFLGFISGVNSAELATLKKENRNIHIKLFLNALGYVFGFSVVFIFFGMLFGFGGAYLIQYRLILSRIGGILIIFFGLYMIGIMKFKWLQFLDVEHKFNIARYVKPGKFFSSFLFGATFAFGWTPCIGSVLGSILLLASTRSDVWAGGFLLSIFSLGLGLPFILIGLFFGYALEYIKKISKYLWIVNQAGGLFLIFIGVVVVTDSFGWWIGLFYHNLNFLNYDGILKFL